MRSRAAECGRLLGFAALVAAGRPASWRRPLSRDSTQYLYVGTTILRGGRPYLDAANNKGPLLYLLFAAIRGVAGTRAAAVRATAVAPAAFAAWALARYVERRVDRETGTAAGAALALLSSAAPFQGDEPNAEHYALAPLVGALALAARPGVPSAAGAGALLSSALLVTPGAAVGVPSVAAEILVGDGGRRRGLGALGAGAATAAGVLWWAGRGGGLEAMRDQVIRPGAYAVRSEVLSDRARRGLGYLLDVPGPELWGTGLVGLVVALREPRLRGVAGQAALWVLPVWVKGKLSAYSHGHHFYFALPGLAAGAAVGARAVRSSPLTALALALGPPACSAIAAPQLRSLIHEPWDRLGRDHPYALAYPAAGFTAQSTDLDDRIIVNASHPAVYWLAERAAPTRFFDVYPLRWSEAYAQERRRALLHDPPAAVVALPGDDLDPDLQELLSVRPYTLAWTFRGARVWLRG